MKEQNQKKVNTDALMNKQLVRRSLQAQNNGNNMNINKSQEKAKVASQFFQYGVSLSRIDKMRASSQLGYQNQGQSLIEFDPKMPTRQSAQSNLGHNPQFSTIQQNQIQIPINYEKLQKSNQKQSSLNQTAYVANENQKTDSRNGSFKNISNSLNNYKIIFSDINNKEISNKQQKTQIKSKTVIETNLEKLEQKLAQISQNNKKQESLDNYLGMLDEVGQIDSSYQQILSAIKKGIENNLQQKKQENEISNKKQVENKQEITDLKQQNSNQERVIKEMKKQMTCYKNEIQGIKKMEQYLTLENYQKLINEFNSLYDHYKGLKSINKKMKAELKQSNQRERTFLKLLKKTQEFGDQATQLEQEYDRLFSQENQSDPLHAFLIDSKNKEQEVINKEGVKIPKLDLTSIYIQREVVSSHNDDEEDSDEGSYFNEQDNTSADVNSQEKQVNFEKQKKAFKEKMLQNLK